MSEQMIDGESIHYIEKGKGLPVVLVHGFPLDATIWEAQIAALSDRYRVIAPELRGFGRSKSQRPFTMETLADDLHQLLGQIHALPCVLGGLSMGGYVALAYVTKYPMDVKGLLLIDTRAEADSTEGKAGRAKMIEAVRKDGSKSTADTMMPKMISADAPHTRPQLAHYVRQLMESCPPLTIEHALEAMRDRRDFCDEMPSIAAPTIILVGDSDVITTPGMAETMHKGIRDSKLVTIKGSGHLTPVEQPEQVNAALRQFLAGLAK